jgi:hypothetical protein
MFDGIIIADLSDEEAPPAPPELPGATPGGARAGGCGIRHLH